MRKLFHKINNNYIVSYVNNPMNVFMFALFFLIVSFEVCQIYSVGILSVLYYALFLLFMIGLGVDTIIKKNMRIGIGYYILMLCINISLLVTIITNFSALYNQEIKIHCCIVVIGSLILIVLHCIQMIYFKIIKGGEKITIDKELLVLILTTVMVSVFPNLECVNHSWPRWDTYNYYNAVSVLSVNNIFCGGRQGLVVCGHISSAFALVSLFIKSISGLRLLTAMYLMNLILMGAIIVLLYFIFKKLFPERKYTFWLLCALLGGVSPYILGTMDFINPEKLLLVGCLLFICGIQYNNYVISILGAFFSCNTREYGTVAIALMTAVSLFKAIIRYKKSKEPINIGFYFCIFVMGGLWYIHYGTISWAALAAKSTQKTWPLLDGAFFNTFDFSWLHIIDIFKGEFLTNFSWIFVGILFFAIIKFMILMIREKCNCIRVLFSNLWNYWEIIFGCIGIELVLCTFITYHLYRYYTGVIILIYIVGIALLNYLLVNVKYKQKISNTILCIIAVAFIVQSYYTIDPVMLNNFNLINTGKNSIAVLDIHMQNYNDPGFTEATHYNRQMLYFDESIDQAIAHIYPDDNKIILVSNEFQPKEGISSVSVIEGHGYQWDSPSRWMKFNFENGRRYLDSSSEGAIQFESISEKTDVYSKYLNQDKQVFYIEMPWEQLASSCLKKKYGDHFVLYKTIEHRNWVINVYQFIN